MGDRGKNKKKPRVAATPHPDRQPRFATPPKPEKRPFTGAPGPNENRTHIAWRFQKLDHDGRWPWHFADQAKSRDVMVKLGQLEGRTWDDTVGKRGTKRIPLEDLPAKSQKEVARLDLDVDALWELHLSGAERVWGVRYENVMFLLWWDPKHEVCPSSKD